MAFFAPTPWREIEEDYLYWFLWTRADDEAEKAYWKWHWWHWRQY